MTTYTVRPLGRTAWKSEIPTLEEAKKEAQYVRRMNLGRVVIIDDETGQIVDEQPDE